MEQMVFHEAIPVLRKIPVMHKFSAATRLSKSVWQLACLSLAIGLSSLADEANAARVALVIGNAAYTDGPLRNPVNDARAMDKKLADLGFTVQRVENLKRQNIGRTISTFANSVKPGDDVVVFYAGHGVQVKGVNYLPAVDADIQGEEDVALNSLNLNSLMERLDEAKAGLKILFLDACRNNPYARSFRSGTRGLARVQDAPSGTLIHFATRPGSVAADGTGANGLYTSQLLKHIDTANTPVELMLKNVSASVEAASQGQQEPWSEGSIKGNFFFKAGPGTQVASITPVPTGRSNTPNPEDEAWAAAKAANTSAAYRAYLTEFPLGRYAGAARIAMGGASTSSPVAAPPAQATTPRKSGPVEIPAELIVKYQISDKVLKFIRESEYFKNIPAPMEVQVRYKSIRNVEEQFAFKKPRTTNVFNLTSKPAGHGCVEATLHKTDDFSVGSINETYFECGGVRIGWLSKGVLVAGVSNIEIDGGLFPIHQGASMTTHILGSTGGFYAKKLFVSGSRAASALHANFTGLAWDIDVEVSNSSGSRNYKIHYIEDLGQFDELLGVEDLKSKSRVFPTPQYRNIEELLGSGYGHVAETNYEDIRITTVP
ncbi:hypothetical protein G7048_23645 [Diaphorobacter sp. HDW4B]|uniref:caspase family protein n=1 Tax=Diaphorobacter sp. HDW4B TaxID=2714925 RepID=UPI00140A50B5|nr:caspase family protein [Diaphorobacter sp. HDW4B]QIL73082.1 hypothetical protein G7048_23645 [Diaphorobacter sp. HDW4B]